MPGHIKTHALSLFGVFTALLIAGLPARAADSCSAVDLRVARSFDIGANGGFTPVAVVAADFNGDSRPDLVATDSEGNAIAVLLNDGTGWFGAPTKFAAGTRPSAIAIADLNGDGRSDLAVTNSGSNNVSILLGSGGGVFGPATNFAVGADPRAVAVADFNGDGNPDLAVGNIGGHSVSLLLGDGAGAFSPAGSPSAIAGQPVEFAVADFNSDGHSDLVAATSSGFFMLAGDGAGRFSEPSNVFNHAGEAAAAADLNGDGKVDLALASSSGMAVLLGDGAGGFSVPAVFAREGGGGLGSVAVGDLDGDGTRDVAAAASIAAGVTFFKGDGAGGFSRTKSHLVKNNPSSIALGDFDGDGTQDIAAAGSSSGARLTNVSLLLNTGGGAFEAPRAAYGLDDVTGFTSTTPFDLALGDFNADGRADMAVLHRPQILPDQHSARVAMLLADASGGFTRTFSFSFFPSSLFYRVMSADFNKDGRADVAVTGTISQPFQHVVSVSLSNGDGTFAPPNNVTISFFGQQPSDLAAGDFNGDGNPDIVVVTRLTQNFTILLGNGAGNFFVASARNIGTGFDRVAVGDFNGDAKQDLVITDYEHQRVLTLLGNGVGQFGPAQPSGVAGSPSAVAVGDFNLDGRRDLAVATHAPFVSGSFLNDGAVSVLLGDGAGNFAAAVNYRVGARPEDIEVGDFDGDGKSDLAVANQESSSISVLSGDGAGAFSPVVNFDISGSPLSLAAHDFDADGRADIAAPLSGSRALGLLRSGALSPHPCLFADDVTVTEGDSGASNAEVAVRLPAASGQVVKVNYMLRDFPATAGQDFLGNAGTLTFQPGETVKNVAIPIVGDAVDEDHEFFTFHLSGPLNARISDGVARINIQDNDPPPTISIGDAAVAEGNSSSNFTPISFVVTLSGPSSKPVSVSYAASGGTATGGTDYDFAQGQLSFDPGTTSKTLTLAVRGDLTHEPDETFFVSLSNPAEATIGDGQGQGTILNDDPVPAVTVLDASGSEVAGGDSGLSVGFRLSNPSSLPVSVDYATADAAADAGSDYVAGTGTVTFNPGQTQKNIALTIKDDALDEVNEDFSVSLSNPVNATIDDGQAVCTIFDNDGPAVSINDVSVIEGQSGRTEATFTLSLSAPSPQAVGVRVTTANGTASASTFPTDYQSISVRFVFVPAGQTAVTLTVFVSGDLNVEPDETFLVNLSQPQDCTIADGQGIGMITNDDTSMQFDTGALAVNEMDGSVQVTVTRIGLLAGVSTVNYSTGDGTASERSDYNLALGTLQFAPDEASKIITLFITDDALVEDSETYSVTLREPVGGTTGSLSTAVITINSDDVAAGPNPVDAPMFFVRQHYVDFLNREPDASGLSFWTGQIMECGADAACREVRRINVSAAFFLSIEFQETGFLAYRTYGAAFGTRRVGGAVPLTLQEFLPDTQEVSRGVVIGRPGAEALLEANKASYFDRFVGRQQFIAAYPAAMAPAAFVDALNANTSGSLSPGEAAQLAGELGAGTKTRAQVLRAVAENSAFRNNETRRAFVLMQYFGYLRRNPNDAPESNLDFGGYDFWLQKLNNHNGNFVAAEMVKAFITSGEYQERFGQ